jgi:hypothetical protein
VEPDAVAADAGFANSNQWNHLDESNRVPSWPGLVDSTGVNSGARLDFSSAQVQAYNDFSRAFPDTYLFEFADQTFTISGLAPNASFTLFLYALNSVHSANDRGAVFTVGSATFSTGAANPSSEDPARVVDGFVTGVTSATGTIEGTWAFAPGNTGREIDWSGFQLDLAPTAAPEPGTFILFGGGLVLAALRTRSRIDQ